MIKKIKLKDFRGFSDYEINTNSSLIIFSGRNATGKTSILESIFYVSKAKSHRTNNIEELLKYDSDYFQIDLDATHHYRTIYSKDVKSFIIDGEKYKKISDYVGSLLVVMFSPADKELVSGSKSVRRRFMNLELSMIDKSYLHILNSYNKFLKERNELLKSKDIDYNLLNVLTEQLINCAIDIVNKRTSFINNLNIILNRICSKLNIEDIKLEYNPSYMNDINQAFKNKLSYDIFTKTTNIGPHRDDFIIKIDDKLAVSFASEGQSRMIAIAIKLALRDLIGEVTKVKPVVLLDDVFASLDNTRILNLIKFIIDGYQTFLTTTSILEIPDELLKNALVIRLQK